MAKTVNLTVITPEQEFYKGQVESLMVKTLEGYEGFLPGRSYMVGLLDEGNMVIREPGKAPRKAHIKGGYVDIKDEFLVLTDIATWLDETEE